MKFTNLTVFALMLSVSGHLMAQDDYLTRYQVQSEAMRKALRKCEATIKDDPRVVRFSNEFIVSDSNPNRYLVLGSNEKLNKEQRLFLIEALPVVTRCRKTRLDAEVGLHVRPITVEFFRNTDLVFGRLLRGEITIGEANSESNKAIAVANAASRKALADLQEQQAGQLPSRAQGQQRSASTSNSGESSSSSLLPFLMQQQMMRDSNDAADLRNRQLIDALAPRPSRTDCSTDGWGNVSCKTR